MLFIPSAVLVLLAGVALVFEGPWSFTGDGWVLAGLLLLLATLVVGLGVIVPAGRKLTALASSGAPAAELEAQIVRLRVVSWVDIGLLTGAIFAMTSKPI